MPMDKWDACAFPVDPEELEGRVCYGGLDLSSTSDITAFVLVFPPRDEEDKYVVLPYFWLPEETLDLRVRRDHVPYDVWEKQDLIETTEGNVIHYGFIEKFIEDFLTAFEKTTDTLTEFSVEAFSSLVEFIAVYSEKDIRVTFRNGQEIKA